MEKLELRFTYEKATKNTCRYKEEPGEEAHSGRGVKVGALYVQKESLGDPPPQRLRVVIEEDTGGKDAG